MKLQNLNKKIIKSESKSSLRITKARKNSTKFTFGGEIPVDFDNKETTKTFTSILNILPDPIKRIIDNGNTPISIKHNDSIIIIKTNTNLEIKVKTHSIDNKIPECRIEDKNTKTILLDTFKK